MVRNCSNNYDQSALGNIDPDINYLSAHNGSIQTPYYDDETFIDKYGNNNKLSMFHLNIRSVSDHFLEVSSYIESLKIEFKIISLPLNHVILISTSKSIL